MNILKGEGILLDLQELGEGPGPYTMSYGFNLDPLRSSIRKVGLINAPLVARNEKGSFDVVSGYRRVLAVKSLGKSAVYCRDVTSLLPTPLERLLSNFYENLGTRAFNEIEKGMFLQRLRTYVSEQEITALFLPLLSLPCHQSTLRVYLKLANLREEFQKALADGSVALRTAKVLLDFDEASSHALWSFILHARFNLNQQMKFMDYVKDISIRENLPVSGILCEESLGKILGHARWNKPQKAKAILEVLRTRRTPRLAKAQAGIQEKISHVALPAGTAIHYDPSLEAPGYRLEINFQNGKDLAALIKRLHSLPELEAIPDPWQAENELEA